MDFKKHAIILVLAKELQDMENALDQHKVEDQTVDKGFKWILICPWCHILEGSTRS